MAARVEAGTRSYDFPNASQRASLFVGETEVIKFIEGKFTPGTFKIQEAGSDPVSPEIQEQILSHLPEFLTQMVFSHSPINEDYPEDILDDMDLQDLTQEQLATLSRPNEKPKQPSTYYLKPDVINTREAQEIIGFTKTEFNRHHREFGHRIWVKLIQKSLKESRAPHAVHPFQELHQFNGMIIGLQTRPTHQSYQEMIEGRRKIAPESIITLANYEIANNLFTDQDKVELYELVINRQDFKRAIKKIKATQGYIPTFIGHLPMTWALIHALELNTEEITILLSYKLANNLLDDYTAETIKEIAENPENPDVAEYLLSIRDKLAGTPLGEIDLFKAKMRRETEKILILPAFSTEEDEDEKFTENQDEPEDPEEKGGSGFLH